jgi:predicted porin
MLLMLTGAPAIAGIMFEPYAGYTTGNIKVDGSSGHPLSAVQSVDDSGTVDGVAYGARLAWTFSQFYLGAEYQGMRAKEKLKDADDSPAWNSTAVYGIVGLQFFTGIRLYVGMTVQDFETTEDLSPEPLKHTGSARKIGIGYRYSAPVAVNLEYNEFDFNDVEGAGVKNKTSASYDKLDYSAVVLSISFPFQIGGR